MICSQLKLKLLIGNSRQNTDPPPLPPSQTPTRLSRDIVQSIEQERGYSVISWAPKPSPAPAVRSTPALASTPTPEPAKVRKARNPKLTSDEHLILMNHVCEHQGEYTSGKIAFWKTIGQLFEEDTGI
jgi:hypothetical protein